ncbi:MAG: hypothetical protein O2843_07790 [Chloroflexi bacterium]|nr:hypothetical protein [Chloroflexota bacterium]
MAATFATSTSPAVRLIAKPVTVAPAAIDWRGTTAPEPLAAVSTLTFVAGTATVIVPESPATSAPLVT